jgi:hypothetical protein
MTKIGYVCYTINASNNQVDSWICIDEFKGQNNELMYELKNGGKIVILPKRCVYFNRQEASNIANKK